MNQGRKKSHYRPNNMLTCKRVGRGTLFPPQRPKSLDNRQPSRVSYVMLAATADAGIVRANDIGRPYNVGGYIAPTLLSR